MDSQIYLDNNATTKCDEQVLNEMLPYLKESYGNPSSIYFFSKEVKERYKNKINSVWSDKKKANHLIECALGIEKQIMEFCTIKPEEINDKSVQKNIEYLRNYEIK